MAQKNKDLLLQDLCSRLPYGVKASYYGTEEECYTWDEIEDITIDGYVDIGQYSLPIEAIKPHLFPLSSMTKEQVREFNEVIGVTLKDLANEEPFSCMGTIAEIDFYHKYHFDYRNLIGKNLALDATGLNIY